MQVKSMRKEKLKEIKSYIEQLKVISSTNPVLVGQGKFLKIATSTHTLINDKVIVREEIVKKEKDAVIILPITTDGNVVLVAQPRPLTEEGVTIELPAGYVDEGEEPINAAYRELREETGYEPLDTMEDLGAFYQDQGCSRSLNHIFIAPHCQKIDDQNLDKDEYIIYFECKLKEMFELINMGYIRSANSVLTARLALPSVKKYTARKR
jgi:ADP-ribose pyrophosphatase